MKYHIILPEDYWTSTRRYPVLYLLHGLTGDSTDWILRTHLVDHVSALALIVVMPHGGDSWYTNSAGNPQNKFEDYIAKDLVKCVDKGYRTMATTECRAIAGLSMGGYGALKFALKYPQEFAFAGSFSGAQTVVHNPDLKLQLREQQSELLHEIFGSGITPTRTANDVYELAKMVQPAALPALYVTCGTEDDLLQSNRDLVALLHQRGIAYEYRESSGAHGWSYWEDQLPGLFEALSRRMKIQRDVHKSS